MGWFPWALPSRSLFLASAFWRPECCHSNSNGLTLVDQNEPSSALVSRKLHNLDPSGSSTSACPGTSETSPIVSFPIPRNPHPHHWRNQHSIFLFGIWSETVISFEQPTYCSCVPISSLAQGSPVSSFCAGTAGHPLGTFGHSMLDCPLIG